MRHPWSKQCLVLNASVSLATSSNVLCSMFYVLCSMFKRCKCTSKMQYTRKAQQNLSNSARLGTMCNAYSQQARLHGLLHHLASFDFSCPQCDKTLPRYRKPLLLTGRSRQIYCRQLTQTTLRRRLRVRERALRARARVGERRRSECRRTRSHGSPWPLSHAAWAQWGQAR